MARFVAAGGSTPIADTFVAALVDDVESDTRAKLSAAFVPHLDVPRLVAPRSVGAMVFTWDDGYASNDTIRQMANERGQRHTFGMTTSLLNLAGRMTDAQVQQLHAEGHEVASHAVTHVSMLSLSIADRVAQFEDSQAYLEALNGPGSCSTWIYPYGGSLRNDTTDRELYGRYERIMDVSGLSAKRWLTPSAQAGQEFFIGRFPWATGDSHAYLMELIRLAARMPVVISVIAHDPGLNSAEPSMADVIEAMDLCQELGVPCITAREAFGVGGTGLVNGGFEDGLTGWPKTGTNFAAETIEVVTDAPDAGMPGTKSLHIVCAGAGNGPSVQQSVPVQPGSYTLSGRVRTNLTGGTGYVRARVSGRDIYAGSTVFAETANLSTSGAWQRFTVPITITDTTAYAYVSVIVYDAAGEAWFDHLHWAPTREGAFG